jgi:hypothetical protein
METVMMIYMEMVLKTIIEMIIVFLRIVETVAITVIVE